MPADHQKECLIDIGLNLSNKRFRKDIEEVLTKARAAGLSHCVLTGTDIESSAQVLALCKRYATGFPGMLHCTAGVHPHEARHWRSETSAALEELLIAPEVVAIGETGLDFNRDFSPRDQQEQVFEYQLELAARFNKPVFMHERDAHQHQLAILRSYRSNFECGVIHCFTGDKASLFNYLDLDLHIGITGWVCDERRGSELRDLVRHIPLNRLMLESDAPYLIPRNIRPKPSSSRNEPAYLPWVLKSLAAHRVEGAEEIAVATTKTAKRFFKLDNPA